VKIPFVGPTYSAISPNIDCQRSVNWYPEVSPISTKAMVSMIGAPGTSLFCNTGVNTVRGMRSFNGKMFVVVGNHLYTVSDLGVMSGSIGTLNTNVGRVVMSDNGTSASGLGGDQLIIVDGLRGYIYNVSTLTFSVIPVAGSFSLNPIYVEFIDGYFVAAFKDSIKYGVSDLYDGMTWNALATSPVGATPDPILSIVNYHQQLWFIKQFNSEIWYDAGTATSIGSPFLRISGAVIDYGVVSPWAVCRASNSLLWMAVQRSGDRSEFVGVVELNGYVPTNITPPAIAYQMGRWGRWDDVFSYTYTQGSHTFCVWTSPSANSTFVYDTTTSMWHERSVWQGSPYLIGRHHSNDYCYFNNKHYVSDYRNGNILELKDSTYTDYNTPSPDPMVSLRQVQHINDNNGMLYNVFYHRLQVDMETGVGTGTLDPMAALSWSDDGGHTWSSEHLASIGKMGEYKTRAVWRRMGRSRDRVFRLAISDPVPRILLGAYAN